MIRTLAAGSYFRPNLSGFGLGDDAALPIADQALLSILALSPAGTYTEWATQTGDVTWTTTAPTQNYKAYSLTDQQLVLSTQAANGVVETLAVIAPQLQFGSALTTIFNGTPYTYEKTEAVYSQLDTNSPPAIYFLYWLTLRESSDPNIGNTSLNYAATQAGGVLVYVQDVPLSSTDRAIPATSFMTALSTQQAMPSVVLPQTPAVQASSIPGVTLPTSLPGLPALPSTLPSIPGVSVAPTPAATPAATTSSGDTTKAVLLVTLGVVAAVGAYRLYESRRA